MGRRVDHGDAELTPLRGLFVVGTDTGVGKTTLTAALIRRMVRDGKRVGALKPVATGATIVGEVAESQDVRILVDALGDSAPRERVCPLMFEEPLAPSVAARRAGKELTREDLFAQVDSAVEFWSDSVDFLVVEGVGGLLCPIAERTTVADLAARLGFPLLVVGRLGLGTLNHMLMTVESARSRSLKLAALVLNGSEPTANAAAEATNQEELRRFLPDFVILPDVSHGDDLDAWLVASGDFAWYDRFAQADRERLGPKPGLQDSPDDSRRA